MFPSAGLEWGGAKCSFVQGGSKCSVAHGGTRVEELEAVNWNQKEFVNCSVNNNLGTSRVLTADTFWCLFSLSENSWSIMWVQFLKKTKTHLINVNKFCRFRQTSWYTTLQKIHLINKLNFFMPYRIIDLIVWCLWIGVICRDYTWSITALVCGTSTPSHLTVLPSVMSTLPARLSGSAEPSWLPLWQPSQLPDHSAMWENTSRTIPFFFVLKRMNRFHAYFSWQVCILDEVTGWIILSTQRTSPRPR